MAAESCCRVCLKGMYSCHWKKPSGPMTRRGCCWLSVLTLTALLCLFWMYVCLVTFNDREDVNWKGFSVLKRWVNWFMVLVIVSAVISIYCVLLLLFALFQVALGEPLDLHWLHKVLLVPGVLFIVLGLIGISWQWNKEWSTVLLSLQATAPFLQMGGVGALTLLSWLVVQSIHRAQTTGSKVVILVVFTAVSAAIFLSPIFISSPCLLEVNQLPPKPHLFGHRGAPMLAPENTMMSFRRSVACNVTAFETDVQLSKDRVPFLMHDDGPGFLRRTTNVEENFPVELNHSSELAWVEYQRLNAGSWFLQTDPFGSLSRLSEQDKGIARNQSIPSLVQLLDLARRHHTSVMFDLKNGADDVNDTVNTILGSGIPQHLIRWLPSPQREAVKQVAPGFTQVYDSISDLDQNKGEHLNLKYTALNAAGIKELRSRDVWVNLWVVNERWLFSLLWCSGASSVTTNTCHLLQDVTQPDWMLDPQVYKIIWITVDVASLLCMLGLFLLKRKWTHIHRSPWHPRELSPFLPR